MLPTHSLTMGVSTNTSISEPREELLRVPVLEPVVVIGLENRLFAFEGKVRLKHVFAC